MKYKVYLYGVSIPEPIPNQEYELNTIECKDVCLRGFLTGKFSINVPNIRDYNKLMTICKNDVMWNDKMSDILYYPQDSFIKTCCVAITENRNFIDMRIGGNMPIISFSAFLKALGLGEYTAKVVCTKCNNGLFVVGGIYDVMNGVLFGRYCRQLIKNVKSLETLNNHYPNTEFIEIKEDN